MAITNHLLRRTATFIRSEMCLLFYHLNEDAGPDSFHLVLANVRDEFWDRPTLPSGFWEDHPSCIGGVDLQAGRGHGTWLAMNREGKMAILLNILMNNPVSNKSSRGCLVSDYVKNKERNIDNYINDIAQKGDQFNLFNLVLFDLKLKSTCYYSNETKEIHRLKSGTHAFGNTEMNKPWKKVKAGKEIFRETIEQFPKVKDKDKLKTALFDLMGNNERHFDEDAAVQYPDHEFITSYIMTSNSEIRYGSRTRTVILIDNEGNCSFLEKTLKTPVVADNFKWEFSENTFSLNLD